jgi:hypothetical protein
MTDGQIIAKAIDGLAAVIKPAAAPGTDATGGHVDCVVEAMMGQTAGLVAVADAINNLAEAIRERSDT